MQRTSWLPPPQRNTHPTNEALRVPERVEGWDVVFQDGLAAALTAGRKQSQEALLAILLALTVMETCRRCSQRFTQLKLINVKWTGWSSEENIRTFPRWLWSAVHYTLIRLQWFMVLLMWVSRGWWYLKACSALNLDMFCQRFSVLLADCNCIYNRTLTLLWKPPLRG